MAVEFMPWTPGSPRLSFSRDFVQSEVFNPSSSSSSSSRNCNGGEDACDFDFGMLSLLRGEDPIVAPPTPMLHADQLFSNGRILPSCKLLLDEDHEERQQQQQQEEEEHEEEEGQQLQSKESVSKPTPSARWKDLFKKQRSSVETECSSSRFAPCKLKLLFRSSSAGAGRSSNDDSEPCLDRSASESKASTSCCYSRDVPADASSLSEEHKGLLRPHKKPPPPRGGGAATMVSGGRAKRDAWRAYNERVMSSGPSSGATLPSSNLKVAEVLHMEVCMGQSMVVSKVAKAFVRKDSKVSKDQLRC